MIIKFICPAHGGIHFLVLDPYLIIPCTIPNLYPKSCQSHCPKRIIPRLFPSSAFSFSLNDSITHLVMQINYLRITPFPNLEIVSKAKRFQLLVSFVSLLSSFIYLLIPKYLWNVIYVPSIADTWRPGRSLHRTSILIERDNTRMNE